MRVQTASELPDDIPALKAQIIELQGDLKRSEARSVAYAAALRWAAAADQARHTEERPPEQLREEAARLRQSAGSSSSLGGGEAGCGGEARDAASAPRGGKAGPSGGGKASAGSADGGVGFFKQALEQQLFKQVVQKTGKEQAATLEQQLEQLRQENHKLREASVPARRPPTPGEKGSPGKGAPGVDQEAIDMENFLGVLESVLEMRRRGEYQAELIDRYNEALVSLPDAGLRETYLNFSLIYMGEHTAETLTRMRIAEVCPSSHVGAPSPAGSPLPHRTRSPRLSPPPTPSPLQPHPPRSRPRRPRPAPAQPTPSPRPAHAQPPPSSRSSIPPARRPR